MSESPIFKILQYLSSPTTTTTTILLTTEPKKQQMWYVTIGEGGKLIHINNNSKRTKNQHHQQQQPWLSSAANRLTDPTGNRGRMVPRYVSETHSRYLQTTLHLHPRNESQRHQVCYSPWLFFIILYNNPPYSSSDLFSHLHTHLHLHWRIIGWKGKCPMTIGSNRRQSLG